MARRLSGSSIRRNSCLLRGWPSFTLNISRPPVSISSCSNFSMASLKPIAQHVLLSHQLLDERFPFVVLMCGNRRRPTDDERRARLVDENRIDFIDNGVAIAALHLFLARGGAARFPQINKKDNAAHS